MPRSIASVLGLLVRHGDQALDVVKHVRATRTAGGVITRAPRVVPGLVPDLSGGEEELAAIVVDRSGRVLSRQAWPATTRSFHESDGRGGGRLRVRVIRRRRDQRQLDVTVPAGGEFVVFYSARARSLRRRRGAPTVVRVRRRVLKALYLNPTPGTPVPTLPPIAGLRVPRRVLDIAYVPIIRAPQAPPLAYAQTAPRPYGHLLDKTFSLHPKARPGRRFDVVIIGDGFAEDEQGKFDTLAKLVVRGLRKVEPFRRLDAKVNYHILYAVSTESGIDGFDPGRTQKRRPARKRRSKKTYFRFTSDLHGLGEPGFFGVRTMETVRGATEKITPVWSEVDLVIAIMNCRYPGGAGYPEHRLAVISRGPDDTPRSFIDRLAHECGHAIAGFAEERVTEDRYAPPEWYPNMATEKQRLAKAIWWRRLAKPSEKRPRRSFAVEHLYPGLLRLNATLDPALPPRDLQKLGLFWGCQCTTGPIDYDPDVGFRGNAEQLVRALRNGRAFYRGMARCRMRDAAYPFCRVCEYVLAEAIRAAARGRRIDDRRFGGP